MSTKSFAFFGCTKFSEDILRHLLCNNMKPKVIFSSPREFNINYSEKRVINVNHADLRLIAETNGIEFVEIDSVEGKRATDHLSLLQDTNLDIILVIGWYYMLPQSIRSTAKYGAWGIHASMLPKYAGGAPLTWAIINGEKETGVTLFRLADGVDSGDIVAQKSFPIDFEDSIKDVYKKATETSKSLLVDAISNIEDCTFQPQDPSKIEVFPQRSPEDGELDLTLPAEMLYNFIRAQSSPYPGAFIRTTDNRKLIIEKARIED